VCTSFPAIGEGIGLLRVTRLRIKYKIASDQLATTHLCSDLHRFHLVSPIPISLEHNYLASTWLVQRHIPKPLYRCNVQQLQALPDPTYGEQTDTAREQPTYLPTWQTCLVDLPYVAPHNTCAQRDLEVIVLVAHSSCICVCICIRVSIYPCLCLPQSGVTAKVRSIHPPTHPPTHKAHLELNSKTKHYKLSSAKIPASVCMYACCPLSLLAIPGRDVLAYDKTTCTHMRFSEERREGQVRGIVELASNGREREKSACNMAREHFECGIGQM
jgi:hypothetical protein